MAVAETRTCAKCGERPAGDGGVLCGTCRERLEGQQAGYWGASNTEKPDGETENP